MQKKGYSRVHYDGQDHSASMACKDTKSPWRNL